MNDTRDKWDERLENWAAWVLGSDQQGGAARISSIYAPAKIRSGFESRPPPPLVGMANDTDDLVAQLCREHFMAVRAWYVWTGSVEIRAADLGCHPNTLRDRVRAAKDRLDVLDQERQRRQVRPA
jgi:hypothetical protein